MSFILEIISKHFPLTKLFTVTDRLLLGTYDPYFTNNEIVVLKMSEIFLHDLFGFLNNFLNESRCTKLYLLFIFQWEMENSPIVKTPT